MGRQLKIGAIALVVLGTVMAGVAYAWDRSNDRIAEGVTIAGLDVGDMTREEALQAVRAEVAEPLAKPVVVTWRDARFTLSTERAKLRVDVEGMVDEAFVASEEGSLVSRTWRRLTGGEVSEALPVWARWSHNQVEDFVAEVAGEVDRPPRDASVEPAAATLGTLHSRAGLTLRQEELVEEIEDSIGTGVRDRVEGVSDQVRPQVRTRDLADRYPHYLTVDRGANVLRYFKDLKLAEEYPISVGAVGYETPAGLYHIENKQVDPAWYVPDREWAGKLAGKVIPGGVPENPLKARWMGFYDGAGIHGTSEVQNLGAPASHGCIRMSVTDVVELYDVIATGTPIFIA